MNTIVKNLLAKLLKLLCMRMSLMLTLVIVLATALISLNIGRGSLSTGSSVFGFFDPTPVLKVATIAKESVIFDAVYDRPGASKELLEREVTHPILDYLRVLQQEGFVVIDTTTDADGRMSVSALPVGAVDLTAELRARVQISAK